MSAPATLYTNCIVWTGEIGSAAPREVLVEDRLIRAVAPRLPAVEGPGVATVDCAGMMLMPGLVDGHSHLSFLETPSIVAYGEVPPEEHMLACMHNARRVLLAGFTSCIGASAAKPRLDIVLRNEIAAGRIPGPRLLAATQEITVTGGLADERRLHLYRESVGAVLDGPDEIRRYVRTMCREGCDIIKLNISGSQSLPHAPAAATLMTEDEIAAAVTTAQAFGRRVMSHAHSAESVRLSLQHGIEFINHCTLVDAPTIDLLEEHRDRVFLAPAFGALYCTAYEADAWGITRAVAEKSGIYGQIERCAAAFQELRRRGLRVLIGGDYGFAWTPHGSNARDLGHFVKYFGYSPEEALVCATVTGAAAMRMADEIGRIAAGFRADFILVRGRPDQDVSCLTPENVALVVKDGVPHGPSAGALAAAAAGRRIALADSRPSGA